MTYAEMNRRLAPLSDKMIKDVFAMIREGYGARGISQNYPVSYKQAEACFALYDHEGRQGAGHRAEASFGC